MAFPQSTNVSAPPVRTSLREGEERSNSGISWAWLKHFQDTNQAVNKAPQIQENVPAKHNSSGTHGNMAFDGHFLYICVAENTWLKFTPSTF